MDCQSGSYSPSTDISLLSLLDCFRRFGNDTQVAVAVIQSFCVVPGVSVDARNSGRATSISRTCLSGFFNAHDPSWCINAWLHAVTYFYFCSPVFTGAILSNRFIACAGRELLLSDPGHADSLQRRLVDSGPGLNGDITNRDRYFHEADVCRLGDLTVRVTWSLSGPLLWACAPVCEK